MYHIEEATFLYRERTKKVHCQDKHKWLFILASILNSSFKKPTVGFIHFLTNLK